MKSRFSFYFFLFLGCYPLNVEGQKQRCNTESTFTYVSTQDQGSIRIRDRQKFQLVFHILYNNDEENISESQIYSQLQILNELFNPYHPNEILSIPETFRMLAGYSNFTFCMADMDPLGNPTDGITRTKIADLSIACKKQFGKRNLMHDVLGGKSIWDPKKYINIYVINRSQCAVLGEAIFPWDATDEEDGIILDYRTVGYTGHAACNQPYHLAKTLVHELGHYFGLLHLSADRNDCTGDDGVEDTPQQAGEYFNCPSGTQLSCGSSDMYMNFMSFVDDACMYFFTKLQIERMREIVLNYRSKLGSTLCNSSGGESINLVYAVHDKGYWTFKSMDGMEWSASVALYDGIGRLIWSDIERRSAKRVIGHPNTEYASGLYFAVLRNSNESKTFTLLKY